LIKDASSGGKIMNNNSLEVRLDLWFEPISLSPRINGVASKGRKDHGLDCTEKKS
jgi:hypothetical protein